MIDAPVANSMLEVHDLGRMAYGQAYARQLQEVERVLDWRARAEVGEATPRGVLLLVEHDPPLITITRRPGAAAHLLASREALARERIDVVETDRGGDITYHGPGQLVAYPILDLNRAGLNLHGYMRLLEQVVIDTCAAFGVHGGRDACATGVWVGTDGGCGSDASAKICALGVRVRRWVSLHGLALNVTTNLDHFGLIVPCGLTGRKVTSLARELVDCPSMDAVKARLARDFGARLAATSRPEA